MNVPPFRSEQTGNAQLDRIQNMVRTLVEYLRGLLWLESNAYVALKTDISTASATYATILTASITTVAAHSFLNILFTASGSRITNAGTAFFQVLVDGVVVKGCQSTVPSAGISYGFNVALVVLAPVIAGRHSVVVQWKTDSATSQISAASSVTEHAAVSIHEEVPS